MTKPQLKQEPAKQSPVGHELVRRLKRFTEELEATPDIAARFTCRTIQIKVRPEAYSAGDVKKTRKKLSASQVVFAQFLGVSPSAVRDWEQGLKPPRGAACRFMDEINRNPQYFRTRLKELAASK